MRKAEATSVTALLRLLWRTQSFSLSFDDSRPFSRHMCCTMVVHEVSMCLSEPNSVARWEEGEERGQLAIAIAILCELRVRTAFGRLKFGKV
jgi:hypothetical protein